MATSWLLHSLFGQSKSQSLFNDIEDQKQNIYDVPDAVSKYNGELIRIAVFGATGTGKSTLCNLICGNSQQFEANDDDDSVTHQTQTARFKCILNNKKISFEVIDCPGFFDTNSVLSKMRRIEAFARDVQKCCDITKNGISAFLFCVPVGRLGTDYQDSIKFMMKYFNGEASKHVIYTFTKCNNKTEEQLMQRKQQNKHKYASKLVLEYLKTIGNQCIATECLTHNSNINYREKVLKMVLNTHIKNNGPTHGNVMWKAFKKQYAEVRKANAKFYAVASLAVSTAGFAAYFGKKYYDVKQDHDDLENRHLILATLSDVMFNDIAKIPFMEMAEYWGNMRALDYFTLFSMADVG